MNPIIERRAQSRDSDDGLSPECLALLLTCGGQVRASDREAIATVRDVELPDRRRENRRATTTIYVTPGAPGTKA